MSNEPMDDPANYPEQELLPSTIPKDRIHDPAADRFRVPFDAIALLYDEEPWREYPPSSQLPTDLYTLRIVG